MGEDSSKSFPEKIIPLQVKEVTSNCITILKTMPLARASEVPPIPADTLPNLLIPQEKEAIFLKLYVTEQILSNGKLEIVSRDLFPNYSGRIFEVEQNGTKQLLLVGLSNELDFEFPFSDSFPFLIYIPPSPQDTAEAHKKRFPNLYSKTPLNNIPWFYKDASNYPYEWDWLYFQFFVNMYKLSYQLKQVNRPYVFVVPLIKSFSDGLGFLNSGIILEKCLLGIQKFYMDEKNGKDNYTLNDLQRVAFISFSIGNSILSNFIRQNRENSFFRNKIKDLIILDPPPGNPNNRSPIIDTIISIMPTNPKNVFLYTQDPYYIQPLISKILTPKGIQFDLSKSKIFSDPRVKNVFFAYLEKDLFKQSIQDPLLRDVHNTFPNLFIGNAAIRSTLTFSGNNQKLHPNYSFLSWAPSR